MSVLVECDRCGKTAKGQLGIRFAGVSILRDECGKRLPKEECDVLFLPDGWVSGRLALAQGTALLVGAEVFCSEHCRELWKLAKDYQPMEADGD